MAEVVHHVRTQVQAALLLIVQNPLVLQGLLRRKAGFRAHFEQLRDEALGEAADVAPHV